MGEEALKKLSDKRNPLFAKFDAASVVPSPVTQSYLSNRRWKTLGGSAFQALGNLLGLAPPTAGVNIPGTIHHGQATALAGLHMTRLGFIAMQYREARTVQDWCRLLEVVKATKLATRGGQLAGSVVPLASMPSLVAAAAIKTGVKLTFTGACFTAAAQIHWIAFNEKGHAEASAVPDAPPLLPPPGGQIDQHYRALTGFTGPTGQAEPITGMFRLLNQLAGGHRDPSSRRKPRTTPRLTSSPARSAPAAPRSCWTSAWASCCRSTVSFCAATASARRRCGARRATTSPRSWWKPTRASSDRTGSVNRTKMLD